MPGPPPGYRALADICCPVCAKSFHPSKSTVRYCSHACAMARDLHPRGKRVQPRPCETCGMVFKPRGNSGKYCSTRCSGRAQAQRLKEIARLGAAVANAPRILSQGEKAAREHAKRAKRRGSRTVEEFDPSEIFARDKWTCHLCRQKTSRAYRRKDPRSPTLDHLIPISLGGKHERANVAAAHLRCNTRRSIDGPAQLRMLG